MILRKIRNFVRFKHSLSPKNILWEILSNLMDKIVKKKCKFHERCKLYKKKAIPCNKTGGMYYQDNTRPSGCYQANKYLKTYLKPKKKITKKEAIKKILLGAFIILAILSVAFIIVFSSIYAFNLFYGFKFMQYENYNNDSILTIYSDKETVLLTDGINAYTEDHCGTYLYHLKIIKLRLNCKAINFIKLHEYCHHLVNQKGLEVIGESEEQFCDDYALEQINKDTYIDSRPYQEGYNLNFYPISYYTWANANV